MRTDYLRGKPWSLRDVLKNKQAETERANLVASFKPEPVNTRFSVVKPLPKKQGGGYHIVGIGNVAAVNGFESVKAIARTAGYTHVRMGAIKTKV